MEVDCFKIFFPVYVALVQNSTRLVSGFYWNISLQFITYSYSSIRLGETSSDEKFSK